MRPFASDLAQTVKSDDGMLQFVVRPVGRSVYVERVQALEGIGRLSHIMRFDDASSFRKACDADDMRFAYPLVFSRLTQLVENSLGSGL
jgi:hypothetical protein